MKRPNFGKTGIWLLWNLYLSRRFVIWLFLLWNKISQKKLTFFCADKTWANFTEQYNNTELKTLRKVLFLVSIFFPIWLAEKTKVWSQDGNVSSETWKEGSWKEEEFVKTQKVLHGTYKLKDFVTIPVFQCFLLQSIY